MTQDWDHSLEEGKYLSYLQIVVMIDYPVTSSFKERELILVYIPKQIQPTKVGEP